MLKMYVVKAYLNNITRNKLSSLNWSPFTFSDDQSIDRLEFLESFECAFSIIILIDADDGIEDQNGENNEGFNPARDSMLFFLLCLSFSYLAL